MLLKNGEVDRYGPSTKFGLLGLVFGWCRLRLRATLLPEGWVVVLDQYLAGVG